MSVSNMVADDYNKEREDIKGLPMFDSANVVTESKKLKMWLMRKKRNHLGLEDRSDQGDHPTTLRQQRRRSTGLLRSMHTLIQLNAFPGYI